MDNAMDQYRVSTTSKDGIIRPSLYEIDKATKGGYVTCTCGVVLTSPVIVADHWTQGHMDSDTFWMAKP